MNKIRFIFFLSLVSFSLSYCKSKEQPAVILGPETNPNTVIRKIEIDQIRVGDKMIRAVAILGKATEINHREKGSEHTWWLVPTNYSGDEYDTLKLKPNNLEGVKFIKLMTDSKGIIISKTMEL